MISSCLKRLRENNGYTQQQVADALNVDRSTYTYYETGKTKPDIYTIMELSRIFNVPYGDIIGEEDRYRRACAEDVDVDSLEFAYYQSLISNYTYELKKEEKELIALFRVLPEEDRKKFLIEIHDRVKKSSHK